MTATTEVAWAAGFFDGEGTTHIAEIRRTRNGRAYGPYLQLFVSVDQADEATLERLTTALGLGRIYARPTRADRLGTKPMFRWMTSDRESGQAVIAMLWPFLSVPKRVQAANCLRRINKRPACVAAHAGPRGQR